MRADVRKRIRGCRETDPATLALMGKLRLGTATVIGAVIAAAACSSPYSATEPAVDPGEGGVSAEASAVPDGATSSSDAASSSLPECKAQRVVHLVGGSGGLAWFTLLWPVPDVIRKFDPTYAYDDPKHASLVVSGPARPLYARTVGGETLFEGTGSHPMVTAFVAGRNQVHSSTPVATYTQQGNLEILGVGAIAQKSLAPKIPVVSLGSLTYVAYPGGPSALIGATLGDVENLVASAAGLPDASAITPDDITVAMWSSSSTYSFHHALAQGLLFAAKAFELGLVGTVLLPALGDDPHAAFSGGTAAPYANILVHMLDSFYAELAKHPEPSCSHNGQPISLADNTVLLVSGDTPKNSYVATGWPDATPGNGNLLYVRSNGFVTPGWFGDFPADMTRMNFDPTTGMNSTAATYQASTDAALGGILYAIARGNTQIVDLALGGTYSGVLAPTAP